MIEIMENTKTKLFRHGHSTALNFAYMRSGIENGVRANVCMIR